MVAGIPTVQSDLKCFIQAIFICVVPKNFNFTIFSKDISATIMLWFCPSFTGHEQILSFH